MAEKGKSTRGIWLFILEVFGLLAAMACILEWLEIKPKDLATTHPLPHILWLLVALLLFGIGIGLSVWSGIVQHRQINEAKRKNEEERRQIEESHTDEIRRFGIERKAEIYRAVNSGNLAIHNADYRAIEGGGDHYEVSRCLRKLIRGDALLINVQNHSFVADGENCVPEDPRRGKQKRLLLSYSYKDGPKITVERREDDLLVVPVDPLIQNFPYLELKALHLANRLLELPKLAGPKPIPKYTEAEILGMDEMTRHALVQSNDRDYAEACENHFEEVIQDLRGLIPNVDTAATKISSRTRTVFPWQDKLLALYESEVKEDLERLIGDLPRTGFRDHGLDPQLDTWRIEKRINALARGLWELAFKIAAKDLSNEKA